MVETSVSIDIPDLFEYRQDVPYEKVPWQVWHRTKKIYLCTLKYKVMNELKIETSSVIPVIDHKQKIEPTKYREPQVEYYSKKGMSLLEMIMIRWKISGNEGGCEYSFHDYVVKRYTSQNHIQIEAIIQVASRIINDNV